MSAANMHFYSPWDTQLKGAIGGFLGRSKKAELKTSWLNPGEIYFFSLKVNNEYVKYVFISFN